MNHCRRPRVQITSWAFAAILLVCGLSSLEAQQAQASVTRDVNLRPTASSDQPAIRVLKPPETVTVLSPDTTNGYYHVRTSQGEDGWVYAPNVSLTARPARGTTTSTTAGGGQHTIATGGANVPTGVFHNCDLTGTATPQAVKDLNVLKNRSVVPNSINSTITASAFMAPGDDTGRFSVDDGATIRLYVTDVKVGGVESVNCGATDPQWRDTHVEGNAIGPSYAGLPMIVEVTPRWRAAESAVSVDWSTQGLHDTLIGHWVEFTGWLLFDREHTAAAMNTDPSKAGQMCGTTHATPCLWRETVWELHPVTSLHITAGPTR